jgi:hypothetical protein
MPVSPGFRCVAIAVHSLAIALYVHMTYAQNTRAPEASTASAELSFDLGRRDPAVSKIVEMMQRQDNGGRTLELAALNANPFTKAIDLLKFIPLRLSISPDDDFLMPDYLQRGYNRVPLEAHLFNAH